MSNQTDDEMSGAIPPLELATRLIVEAKALARQAQHEAAIKLLRRATELAPTCHEAWYELYRMLRHLGWYDDALDTCDQARARMPEDRALWLWSEAIVLNDLGEFRFANEALDEALEISDWIALWDLKAVVLKNWRHFAEAIEAADHALAINPRDHTAMGMKAISLDAIGHKEEAKVLRERAQEAFLEWRTAQDREEREHSKPIAEA